MALDRDAQAVTKALLVILDAIFSGTVHYANTKIQPLVNNSTLIGSSKMQQYFLKLHPSLNVQRWKLEETLRQRQRAGDLIPPGRPGTVTTSSRGKNIPRLIMAKLRLSLGELANGNQHINSSVLEPDAMVDAATMTALTLPSDADSVMDSVQFLMKDSIEPSSMAEPLNILPTLSMPMAPLMSVQPQVTLPELDPVDMGTSNIGSGASSTANHTQFSWDSNGTPSIISEPLPVMPMNSSTVTSSSSVTGNNVVYIRAYSPYRGPSQNVSGKSLPNPYG